MTQKTFFYIITFHLVLLSLSGYGQTDSISQDEKKYSISTHFPFYNNCENCSVQENRQGMLCGHNYKTLFTGYQYDGNNWVALGFAKDVASCFPDIGSNYYAISYSLLIDKNFANSFSLTYLRDNLFGLQFYFIKYGLNLETITDFNKTNLVLRPEIRLCDNIDYCGFLSRINISYGINIKLNNSLTDFRNLHQLTITLKLRNRGIIS